MTKNKKNNDNLCALVNTFDDEIEGALEEWMQREGKPPEMISDEAERSAEAFPNPIDRVKYVLSRCHVWKEHLCES